MGKQTQNTPDGPPPSYPEQVHLDAGPVPGAGAGGGASPAPQPPASPYNPYGGFNNPTHKASAQNLDPRQAEASHYGGSPAPPQGYGAYGQAPPQGYYGYGAPQGMHYGPPPQQGYGPGPGYGPGYGYPPQQGGYYGDRGYYDRRDDGLCGALLAASACCCCLDMCMLF